MEREVLLRVLGWARVNGALFELCGESAGEGFTCWPMGLGRPIDERRDCQCSDDDLEAAVVSCVRMCQSNVIIPREMLAEW